ncbi:hypothetical protein [Kitasatospora sp. McL0602]|uniref:hypothetical protein n=1 Tax=Kitasatospora sp. McL0602 TaxID=3439530 RepID=UPI003F8AB969
MRGTTRGKPAGRVLAGLAGLMLTGAVAVGPAQAATGTVQATAGAGAGQLGVSALAFAQPTVDATSGTATATLNWTVTDSNTQAANVTGDVYVQQIGSDGRGVGTTYDVTFSFQRTWDAKATLVSGTAQQSSYTYDFPVPQYAGSATARWAVVKVAAKDDKAAAKTFGSARLADFNPTVTATELVDSTGPAYQYAKLPINAPEYLYNADKSVTVSYDVDVTDAESGVFSGELEVTGPNRASASTKFEVKTASDGTTTCGTDFAGWGSNDVICHLAVTVPAGAPAGQWVISRLRLTDNAGNTASYRGLSLAPVQITQNAVLRATGFSISPKTVNNWAQAVPLKVTMTPVGVQQGIKSVTVWTGNGCAGSVTASPAVAADGTITVPAMIFQKYSTQCTITGIALTDGAGDTAAYGSIFAGPALDLVVTQIPDTTAPVISNVTLSTTTLAASQLPAGILVTSDVNTFAGISGSSITIYNSAGYPVNGSYGGTKDANGQVQLAISLPAGTPPGDYWIGFSLDDNGDLHTSYGYPNSTGSAVGGPLHVTVTNS